MSRYIRLNNGENIPVLGLGTWQSKNNLVGNAVEYAITKAGYRHIDCASIYGNEKEIGGVFKNVIGKSIKRKDLFVTSKLWNTNHHPDNVEKACRKTLSDLHLEYLDLYLIHWGIAFHPNKALEPLDQLGWIITEPVSIQQTWQAMENLVKKDLVKSIGIANFTAPMILDLLTYAKIKPAMNQIEIHPYNSQTELTKYCHHHKIEVTAYSPLGRQGVIKIKGLNLFEDKIILSLAKKYKKTPAQILLNWGINRGTIVIPKSTTPERISENTAIFDFNLTKNEIKEIDLLNKNHRFVDPSVWWKIPYFR